MQEDHSPMSNAQSGQRGGARAAAWMVHALTASGAVLSFLALMATIRGDWTAAVLWLLVALAVDGIDGPLARWTHVKTRAPRIDGDAMDLIVDYLSYVFVPTLLIVQAGLVPEAWAMPLAALIQLAAVYAFVRRDLKTEDNYFRGFPGLWNVVAFYLLLARPGEAAGAIVILLFAALTFAPVHFVHPFRVRDYGRWPIVLAMLWTAATAALLWPDWSEGARTALLAASGTAAALLVALGLLRTVRGPRRGVPAA